MTLSKAAIELIDELYPAGSRGREIFMRHSESVAALALEIARRLSLPLTDEEVATAAMLHDIGICLTDAPSIGCNGSAPYIRHGVLGAQLLRDRGIEGKYARVAERHTGAGLTAAEIEGEHLPLPAQDLLPETLLERLICYADKFYSKSGEMKRKPLEKVRAGLAAHGTGSLERFDRLHAEFGKD